ncbi:MAG: alpha-glucosidase/alpha-galactosidase [Candidatus Sumerlaeota bacterium]|nr:alpha-glucosidase/alpha-galactosidase [Candidatus Sumerlaeota bacterium]
MAEKNRNACEIKIGYIGGGSRMWAHKVMCDLALCPDLRGEIALYDIHFAAAQANAVYGNRLFAHPQSRTRFRVTASKTLAGALKGADFVVASILPGPMWMMANDIDIPLKYGILQPVGDTTGPAGVSRALRTIPIYAEYAPQIMTHCPRAWVINYTNPMTLCTATLYAAEPQIKAFGCCHEVFASQGHLAQLVHEYLDVPRPPRHEIKVDVAGVNHFTFFTAASWNGVDLFPILRKHVARKDIWADQTKFALDLKATGGWFAHKGLVGFDLFRRFGALGAAGDRHLAEFLPWFLVSEEAIHRYGFILTPSSYRMGTWKPREKPARRQPDRTPPEKKGIELKRSGEEGINQVCALAGLAPLDTNVNLSNTGQIPGLPLGAVVETNAQFRRDSLRPIVPKPLPAGALELVRRVAETQRLTLQAGLARDADLAFQALLTDSLCRIPVDKAWKMFRELLKANQAMLPGYKI